jgi:hypothetical protein
MLTRRWWIQKHLTVGRSCALGHLSLLIIVQEYTRQGKGSEGVLSLERASVEEA